MLDKPTFGNGARRKKINQNNRLVVHKSRDFIV